MADDRPPHSGRQLGCSAKSRNPAENPDAVGVSGEPDNNYWSKRRVGLARSIAASLRRQWHRTAGLRLGHRPGNSSCDRSKRFQWQHGLCRRRLRRSVEIEQRRCVEPNPASVNWTALTDNQATLAIGAIAIQPQLSIPDPTKSVVLAGTGGFSVRNDIHKRGSVLIGPTAVHGGVEITETPSHRLSRPHPFRPHLCFLWRRPSG